MFSIIKTLLPSSAFHARIDAEEGLTLQKSQLEDSSTHFESHPFPPEYDSSFDFVSILNITGLNYYIENMFRDEKKFLLILSPYLKLTKKLITILSMSDANITLIYRNDEKDDKEDKEKNERIKEIVNNIPYINIHSIPNLHAKAYISQTYTIITSLNLYEHSLINNFELGVLIKNENANKLIDRLKEDFLILFNSNNLDTSILDNLYTKNFSDKIYSDNLDNSDKPYTYKELYNFLLDKYNINKIYANNNFYSLTSFISNKLKLNFPYSASDLRKEDKTFIFATRITKEMYEYGINNIELQKTETITEGTT